MHVPQEYDHIVAIDYAERNVAIARLTRQAVKPKVTEGEMTIKDLQHYCANLSGTTLVVWEETTTAQYLYCELRDYVTRVLICDPYMNRLLSDGPKNDKIDACKLVLLARAGMLKEVFHSTDEVLNLRKLVSGYLDVVVAGTRLKNQKSALYRQAGRVYKEGGALAEPAAAFVLHRLDQGIIANDRLHDEYISEFARWRRKDKRLRYLAEAPGIATICAVKILATVVDAKRFANSGKYLAYCGLVWQELWSGGRKYGCRRSRYSRLLKGVYKTAAMAAIGGNNDLNDYYEYLLEQGAAEHHARHTIARQIAIATYGMLKTGTRYRPYQWREHIGKRRTLTTGR